MPLMRPMEIRVTATLSHVRGLRFEETFLATLPLKGAFKQFLMARANMYANNTIFRYSEELR